MDKKRTNREEKMNYTLKISKFEEENKELIKSVSELKKEKEELANKFNKIELDNKELFKEREGLNKKVSKMDEKRKCS